MTAATESQAPAAASSPAKTADQAQGDDSLSAQGGGESEGSWQQIPADDPLVIGRLAFYQKNLQAWQAVEDRAASQEVPVEEEELRRACRKAAEQALASYRLLQSGEGKPPTPWQIVAREANYSDKNCDRMLAKAEETGPAPQQPPVQPLPADDGLAARLQQRIDDGDYAQAATAYEEAIVGQGQPRPSTAARRLYGKALVKIGRFDDAIKVYTDLLAEVGGNRDLDTLALREESGNLLVAAGRIDDARQVYAGLVTDLTPLVGQKEWAESHTRALNEQISEETLARYQEVMRAFLRCDGRQVPQALTENVVAMEATPGPLSDLAKMMLAQCRSQAQNWIRQQLTEIRSLIAAKDLQRAHVRLDQLTAVATPEMTSTVAQLQVELEQAETTAGQAPSPQQAGTPAADPWQEAMQLYEQQKYDEAIAGFQQFIGTGREQEAQAKIAEASEAAAAAMRRQAAALFAKAKNTFDPAAKRQMLLDSRALLEQIIERYPQAPTVEKARQNLNVINTELGAGGQSPGAAAP